MTAIGRPGGFAREANFIAPPFEDVQTAVYLVTLAPPLLLGPLKVTLTFPAPVFFAFTCVGWPGTDATGGLPVGTNDGDAFDTALVPFTLVSVTRHV